MKKLILIFLLLSSKIYAQYYDIKHSVAFIFEKTSDTSFAAVGTGFYTYMPSKQDTTKMYPYLVTAQHVILDQSGKVKPNIYIRVFDQKELKLKYEIISLTLNKQSQTYFFHNDNTVDLAVIELPNNVSRYDLRYITPDMFVTKDDYFKQTIAEGSEVYFCGLFPPYFGYKNNYPIIRFGKVALITNEKVFWNNKYRNLFLLETTTYWGNSGSPVFFEIIDKNPKYPPNVIPIGPAYKRVLAGVMNGFFGTEFPIQLIETKQQIPASLIHFGIAAVTPAYLIYEILTDDALKKKIGEL